MEKIVKNIHNLRLNFNSYDSPTYKGRKWEASTKRRENSVKQNGTDRKYKNKLNVSNKFIVIKVFLRRFKSFYKSRVKDQKTLYLLKINVINVKKYAKKCVLVIKARLSYNSPRAQSKNVVNNLISLSIYYLFESFFHHDSSNLGLHFLFV